jgi:hypothetical protein
MPRQGIAICRPPDNLSNASATAIWKIYKRRAPVPGLNHVAYVVVLDRSEVVDCQV